MQNRVVSSWLLAVATLRAGASQGRSASGDRRVVASWGTSQQIPEPQNALPMDDLRDATVRQIFHLSLGGTALRVHLSNAFGTQPLHFTSVHIAQRGFARGGGD